MLRQDAEPTRLDDHLDQLVANLVRGAAVDEPEALLPPRVSLRRIDRGLGVFQLGSPTGKGVTILVGGQFYDYVHRFTAAAATYFLPSTPGGRTPSQQWPAALDAMVTTLQWASSPTRAPLPLHGFPVTARQRQAARAFGDYTFRFAVAHELAHAALGHEGIGVATSPSTAAHDEPVLRHSQESELEADAFGLALHVQSIPDASQLATALASCMYFLYVNHFLDARLMLLAQLVDENRWKIRLTHPPLLHRAAMLTAAAGVLAGTAAADGLESLRVQLWHLVSAIWDAARTHNDTVTAQVVRTLRGGGRAGGGATILKLFGACPVGVLHALDAVQGESRRNEEMAALVDDVVQQLPDEFRSFHSRTRAERVDDILGSIA